MRGGTGSVKSYKRLFTRSLAHIPAHRHAAAHSHHLRPDVVERAALACLDDAFALADRKWDKFFGEVYPRAQAHVARLLGTGQPESIVFASSTHELLSRLISCLPARARILTTDAEFHSADRQLRRLEESGGAVVTRVPAEPFGSFGERFASAAREPHELALLSHVFFNSGHVVPELEALVAALGDGVEFIAIDGYHAFLALPVDLSRLAHRVFYLAGGYKYAMSGEGACFMHAPPGHGARPIDTGWFAGFGALEAAATEGVAYPADATRFAGATLAPDGIYRLEAVLGLLAAEGVDAAVVHDRVARLQQQFLERLASPALPPDALLVNEPRGNFLTWRTPRAAELARRLLEAGIFVDHRGDRLRMGFGLYHDPDDIESLAAAVSER